MAAVISAASRRTAGEPPSSAVRPVRMSVHFVEGTQERYEKNPRHRNDADVMFGGHPQGSGYRRVAGFGRSLRYAAPLLASGRSDGHTGRAQGDHWRE